MRLAGFPVEDLGLSRGGFGRSFRALLGRILGFRGGGSFRAFVGRIWA